MIINTWDYIVKIIITDCMFKHKVMFRIKHGCQEEKTANLHDFGVYRCVGTWEGEMTVWHVW